jgi:hypothetical protein
MIRKQLAAIGRIKSMGPDNIPGEILKPGGEIMIPYLVWMLDLTMNNVTIPSDRKRARVVHIYKEGDRTVSQTDEDSLTSVLCKQMEHVIAGYL